jgi:hypothetical protein
MMPLPRVNPVLAEVGLDSSFMPSGDRGIDNLPPISRNLSITTPDIDETLRRSLEEVKEGE